MPKFKIIPTSFNHPTIETENAEEAMAEFIKDMYEDMHNYFQAIPCNQPSTICSEAKYQSAQQSSCQHFYTFYYDYCSDYMPDNQRDSLTVRASDYLTARNAAIKLIINQLGQKNVSWTIIKTVDETGNEYTYVPITHSYKFLYALYSDYYPSMKYDSLTVEASNYLTAKQMAQALIVNQLNRKNAKNYIIINVKDEIGTEYVINGKDVKK